MPITCTVTPQYNYVPNDTVTHTNLNEVADPGVEVPDGGMLNLAIMFASDGTAAAPSISFKDETKSGFYRPSAGVLGVVIASDDIFTVDADGIHMETGKGLFGPLLGPVLAPLGTAATPSITFDGNADSGIWYDGGVRIGDDGITGIQVGDAAIGIYLDTTFTKSISVTQHLYVAGDLAVGGKFTGSATNFAKGTPAAPGFPVAGNTDTGLYGPSLATMTDRVGISVGGTPLVTFQRNGLTAPHMVLSNIDSDPDWSLYPAILHISPPAGAAAINFANSEVPAGANSVDINSGPSGGICRWLKARIGVTKIVIPFLAHDWL